MAYPQLQDDGQTVTLDLHGATVEEAIALTQNTLREASRRGRTQVKLIHGSSTSSTSYRNETIKYALYNALERGVFDAFAGDEWLADDYFILALDTTAPHDPTRLRLLDVQ